MAADATVEPIEATLKRGWRHFESGKFDLAADVYISVLQREPNHGNALHCLGRVVLEKGHAMPPSPI